MKITVTSLSDSGVFTFDVSEDLEIENFKAFVEVETGIPSAEIGLIFNGVPLVDLKKSLAQYGVKDGDMVVMDRIRQTRQGGGNRAATQPPSQFPNIDFSQIQIPGNLIQGGGGSNSGGGGARPRAGSSRQSANEEDPDFIRQMLAANPDQLSMLKQNNPRLAEAYESGNKEEFSKVLREQQNARKERELLKIRMMNADPFDLEAQQLIAKEIQQKNIDANMELAMEASPESFGSVIMLYINLKVNGHHVKAFVDSGAQATIMSQKAAERCNIMRLVDQRWAGIAKGVGTQKIIGRVHMAQIQIENDFLTSSFSILEEQPMDMLLGLDMLKRHLCSIDLKKGVLHIGTTGTETPFLTESDLPPCARLSSAITEEDAIKASAKDTASIEDQQLAEALARSASETSMDTSSSHKSPSPATASASSGVSAASGASAVSSEISSADKFGETEISNVCAVGFTRDQAIQKLRQFNGDSNQAVAALFAESLSKSFAKRK